MVDDLETRLLDAAKCMCSRWGISKVTVDDIANEAGVSRATLYRIFPGGKDVLFEALRVRERSDFFDTLAGEVVDIESLDDLVVGVVVSATRQLRNDEALALMLAAEPGEVLSQLTAEGMPRIVDTATEYLVPLLKPHLDESTAEPLIDLLVRVTLSYFLAPSPHVDLGDPGSARRFLRPGLELIERVQPAAASPRPAASPPGSQTSVTT